MILRNTWLKRTGLTATLGIKAMFNIAQTVDKMVPGAMHPEPF